MKLELCADSTELAVIPSPRAYVINYVEKRSNLLIILSF